jgi:serine/threonine protein kinase
LKPDNLLVWQDRWVVADFGIASFPAKDELTTSTHKLGPVHFIAPEMLNDPKRANGGPVDVYSLAKTLWVLLSDLRYPLPGEQRADNVYVRIERWVQAPGIDALNGMFDRCTRFQVEDRLTMSELRDGHAQWLSKYAPSTDDLLTREGNRRTPR